LSFVGFWVLVCNLVSLGLDLGFLLGLFGFLGLVYGYGLKPIPKKTKHQTQTAKPNENKFQTQTKTQKPQNIWV